MLDPKPHPKKPGFIWDRYSNCNFNYSFRDVLSLIVAWMISSKDMKCQMIHTKNKKSKIPYRKTHPWSIKEIEGKKKKRHELIIISWYIHTWDIAAAMTPGWYIWGCWRRACWIRACCCCWWSFSLCCIFLSFPVYFVPNKQLDRSQLSRRLRYYDSLRLFPKQNAATR